ncbi:MAG: XdhC/CoxI family protein [Deltaproteobacteria bacterium]|nr:MAG: XdhC/CoxI family protein [Deltaproteobacteria bacterium]RLC18085.1 MAG: XdhC/CoxI family protein [Deltaproteobacteria bacterium]
MNYYIKELCQILKQEQPVVMATVLSHQGSTPRGAGSRMLVLAGGEIIGTIGGGKVEAEVMQTASELFDSETSQIRSFDLSKRPDLDDLDVICGGQMTILIEYIHATVETINAFQELQSALKQGKNSFMIASLQQISDGVCVGKRCHIQKSGKISDKCPYPETDLHQLAAQARGTRIPVVLSAGEQEYLIESYIMTKTAFIFGAGHVGKQVATISDMVGFTTIVLDDRKEFANSDRFPGADQILVLDTFEDALPGLSIDTSSYIVILTRGHRHDQTVLSQALKTGAGYIGMIGSRKKRDTIYRNLLNDGFTSEDIARVHSPIGLEIKAETPEEIGVSIVAELILERAKR